MPGPGPRRISFESFEADLDSGELWKNGRKIRLQPQPFRLLEMMILRPWEVVTREEIRQSLWKSNTFVDFDHSLGTAINKLRDALGDSAERPRFIETLPRRGYRFIGQIKTVAPIPPSSVVANIASKTYIEHAAGTAEIHGSGPEAFQPPNNLWTSRFVALALVGAFGILAVASWLVNIQSSNGSNNPKYPLKVFPLTDDPGAEFDASFSPDGRQIAYVKWDGDAPLAADVYVKLIAGGSPLRLTHGTGWVCCTAWSNDGRFVLYDRCEGDQNGLHLVAALGGSERKLANGGCEGNSWSPDGSSIAFAAKESIGPWAIFILRTSDLQKHRLTTPPGTSIGDRYPAFSPDGRSLAFVRASSPAVTDIYVTSLDRGDPRRITFDNTNVSGIAWDADGKSLVFSSHRAGSDTLWRVSKDGGTPKSLPLSGTNSRRPAVSLQGDKLLYTRGAISTSIWAATIDSHGGKIVKRALLPSTSSQAGPQFSPDGSKIVFYSAHSGNYEIWTVSADGSNPIQLTSLGVLSGTPRWSPDGQTIAFDSRRRGHSQILIIPAQGGTPRQITDGEAENSVPSWSRDGKWIYFTSNRAGAWNIWKTSVDSSQPVQVTRHGGFAAFESFDGLQLYFVKENVAGIWKQPAAGGDESMLLDTRAPWGLWAVVPKGIYFIDPSGAQPQIMFYNSADKKLSALAPLEKVTPPEEPGLSVSPDGREILYVQVKGETDIMLVENFK